MEDYNKPLYLQNFERVNYFSEYRNNDNDFIKLVYYINRQSFKSALNTNKKLRNYTAYNNQAIFSSYDAIDFDKYTLKEETKEDSDIPNVLKVTEVYGYAPSFTSTSYDSAIVSKYGTSDSSGYLKVDSHCGTFDLTGDAYPHATDNAFFGGYDALNNQYILPFNTTSEISSLAVGDTVILNMPYCHKYFSGTSIELAEIQTGYTVITEKGTTPSGKGYIKLRAIEASIVVSAEQVDTFTVGQYLKGYPSANNVDVTTAYYSSYAHRAFSLIRMEKQTKPSNRNSTIKVNTSFYADVPELEQKFIPLASDGSETDTIDEFSTPNITVWKKLKAGTATSEDIQGISGLTLDGYMQCEDATLTNFHGIYKKDLKYTKII